MEKDEEFLYSYFTCISELCFDKAKEHIEKEKEVHAISQKTNWIAVLTQLQQIALAEKNYMEIGFLQSKTKGFLRKDNSLKSVYETIKVDMKRIEDSSRVVHSDVSIDKMCTNVAEFVSARIALIELYDKIYYLGVNRTLKYNEILNLIEKIIQKNIENFTDIYLTPVKAVFSLECEILEQCFKSLIELQRLQFLSSLALIHGAFTRLNAWENKLQNRETRMLGLFKNTQLPALYQWHQKLRGALLSKFTLFFYNTLSTQTTVADMKQQSTKLNYDYYTKISSFQKKYDAVSVFLLSESQVSCDTTNYDSFPIIVSSPLKPPSQLETVLKMLSEVSRELSVLDKIIYKYCSQNHFTYILTTVEPNIHIVIIFNSKKSEKDIYINTFLNEICTKLRLTKVFLSLKTNSK